MGFNQMNPPDRTVCVAGDLSAAFDTVCHNNMLSKINISQLPPATARWLCGYPIRRQAKSCIRGVKPTSRKVVPKVSKLSPSLFSFYMADMPTNIPSKAGMLCDNLHVGDTWVKIPDIEDNINSYIDEISAYLKTNSLMISTPMSSVTLLIPDTHQAKTNSRITYREQLLLVQWPKIIGVHLDTSLSFNKHSDYVAERVSSRNNILTTMAGTSWGQQKETLLITYKAVGRSIINYATCLGRKPTRPQL